MHPPFREAFPANQKRLSSRVHLPSRSQVGSIAEGRSRPSPCAAAAATTENCCERGDSEQSLQWSLELGGCIGRGGFGRVYLGRWHKAPVAIKVRARGGGDQSRRWLPCVHAGAGLRVPTHMREWVRPTFPAPLTDLYLPSLVPVRLR